jgi:hypothetical protein
MLGVDGFLLLLFADLVGFISEPENEFYITRYNTFG